MEYNILTKKFKKPSKKSRSYKRKKSPKLNTKYSSNKPNQTNKCLNKCSNKPNQTNKCSNKCSNKQNQTNKCLNKRSKIRQYNMSSNKLVEDRLKKKYKFMEHVKINKQEIVVSILKKPNSIYKNLHVRFAKGRAKTFKY